MRNAPFVNQLKQNQNNFMLLCKNKAKLFQACSNYLLMNNQNTFSPTKI